MSRRRILRIGGWVFVSCVLLAGATAAYPSGPTGLFNDVTGYQQNSESLADGLRTEKEIDSAIVAAAERQRLKVELRGAVARGEIRLADAAGVYLQSLASEPELLARFHHAIPASTDEARVAVTLLRDLFVTTSLSATEQQDLLNQYRTTYGSDYPLSVPPPVDSRSEAQSPQLRR